MERVAASLSQRFKITIVPQQRGRSEDFRRFGAAWSTCDPFVHFVARMLENDEMTGLTRVVDLGAACASRRKYGNPAALCQGLSKIKGIASVTMSAQLLHLVILTDSSEDQHRVLAEVAKVLCTYKGLKLDEVDIVTQCHIPKRLPLQPPP